ncbi:MAG: hypothetical protein WCA13_10915 [Terriglobales bacterium]
MAANQVVLYFDKQEDALLFTLAASSVMSAEGRFAAATQRSRLRRRFAKPVESRLRVF